MCGPALPPEPRKSILSYFHALVSNSFLHLALSFWPVRPSVRPSVQQPRCAETSQLEEVEGLARVLLQLYDPRSSPLSPLAPSVRFCKNGAPPPRSAAARVAEKPREASLKMSILFYPCSKRSVPLFGGCHPDDFLLIINCFHLFVMI